MVNLKWIRPGKSRYEKTIELKICSSSNCCTLIIMLIAQIFLLIYSGDVHFFKFVIYVALLSPTERMEEKYWRATFRLVKVLSQFQDFENYSSTAEWDWNVLHIFSSLWYLVMNWCNHAVEQLWFPLDGPPHGFKYLSIFNSKVVSWTTRYSMAASQR